MKNLVLTFLALILSACASPVPSEKLTDIKSVAIISAIGDTVTFQDIGTTVFENKNEPASIASWGIDDLVTETAAARLKGRYDVRSLNYDRSAFLNVDGSALGDIVRSAGGEEPIDAYIVVEKLRTADVIGQTNQPLEGLGLYRRNFLGLNTVAVYAAYRVVVVDGHSFGIIGSAEGRLPNRGRLVFKEEKTAYQRVGRRLWAASLDAMSDAQRTQLESTLKNVIAKSLVKALGDLKLVE